MRESYLLGGSPAPPYRHGLKHPYSKTSPMTSEPTRLTREQLYDLVWSEPMSVLAPKFGISDVALKKTCKKLRVPTPGRGYWRRRERGYRVKQIPLPKLPASTLPDMLEVTLRHREDADSAGMVQTGPVAEQSAFEAKEENRIVVSAVLSEPHALVARMVQALRKAKPDTQGVLQPRVAGCLAVKVTLDTADRAMCVADALLKALDARGFVTSVQQGQQRSTTVVRVHGEEIPIELTERIDRRDVTADARSKREYSWMSPRFEWVATGRLQLGFDGPTSGYRRSWSDGKKQRVEECLNDFIIGLVAASEGVKAQRIEREKWQREWREAEERRQAETRRREEEAARVRALRHSVDRWSVAVQVRSFAAAAREAVARSGLPAEAEVESWLDWVDRYADRIDPLRPSPKVPTDPESRLHSESGF
jgi:hypothetical protein